MIDQSDGDLAVPSPSTALVLTRLRYLDYKWIKVLFFFLFSVLFVSVLSFCVAGSIILSDNRRQLVNSVQLYQPSFLYAYLAIFLQGGVIQVRKNLKAKLKFSCPYLGGAQRAKFAKMVHKPPLGVSIINFELNGFNASIWVPWSPSDPKKSWCTEVFKIIRYV